MVVMLPTPHGAYSRKEQSEREGEVGKSGRNTTRFLRRENGASPQNAGLPLSLVPWASHLDVNLPLLPPPPPASLLPQLTPPLHLPQGGLVLASFTCLLRCSEPSSANGDAVIRRV